jgi:ribonuclease Z
MHGDHIFGLPPMLLALQIASIGAKDTRQVDVYGPVGLYNFIAASISLSCSELKKLSVHVHELVGGTMRSSRYAANRNSFPEFGSRGLIKKELHQNKDGTWTIEEPLEITTPELAAKHNSQPKGLSIKAAELHHVPQLQCFGYTIQEPTTLPRKIDAAKAAALGVVAYANKNFSLLKSGFPVKDKEGIRTIYPEEVLVDERRRPRKITVLGDCCMVPPVMQELAMDSDVLVHEATNSKDDENGRKALSGGHSSASQAALFANKVRAKVLLLNHLGSKIDVYPGMRECIKEAMREITGPTKVQLCFDHLELCVPRQGFDFEKADSVKQEHS